MRQDGELEWSLAEGAVSVGVGIVQGPGVASGGGERCRGDFVSEGLCSVSLWVGDTLDQKLGRS